MNNLTFEANNLPPQVVKYFHQWFEEFIEGKKTLPFLYDPFFKFIFHPDIHKDRLSELISDILEQKIQISEVLTTESILIDEKSILIMDMIVRLEDGSTANIEIQKMPYAFPAERMSCYSSDLVLRQYSRIRSEHGKNNSYNNMKKVYTIIFFEKSTKVFHDLPGSYIHHGKTTFDTHLNLELLQEYCLISLDIFKKYHYDESKNNPSKQSGWLSFLITEYEEEALSLIEIYPWLAPLYLDATNLRNNPKEAESMWSKALHQMDANAMQYMVEIQQEELKKKDAEIENQQTEIQKKDAEIENQQTEIQKKDAEIERLKKLLEL